MDQIFGHWDKDGSGSISTDELGTGLRKMFKDLTDEDIRGLVRVMDADHSGDISLKEFKSAMAGETLRKAPSVSSSGVQDSDALDRVRKVIQNATKTKNVTGTLPHVAFWI